MVKYDVNNCFPTLAVNKLAQNIDMSLFPTFQAFAKNYKEWREFLVEYEGISMNEAKKILIAIVHMGKPKHDLPFLWNLAIEIQKAVGMVSLRAGQIHT